MATYNENTTTVRSYNNRSDTSWDLLCYLSEADGYNAKNNTTEITCGAYLSSPTTSWSSSYYSTLSLYWHDNKDNVDVLLAQTSVKGLGYQEVLGIDKTFNVTHKNDGTLSGYAWADWDRGSATNFVPKSCQSVIDWTTLENIPRYASISQSLRSKTENSISINWSSDSTVDYVWYSTDNGSTWTAVGSVNATSGYYTISNLNVNTSYAIKTKVRRKDSQLESQTTDPTNISTYDYPKITNPQTFVIGEKIKMTLYNPMNRSCNISIIGNDNSVIGGISSAITNDGLIEIESTAAQISAQYASIPNSKSGTYKVRLIVDYFSRDTTITATTYSIKDDGSEIPNFENTDWSYVSNLTQLTNNNQVIINRHSEITFTVNTPATSSYGTTIARYLPKWGDQSSQSSLVVSGGTGSSLELDAIDARGLLKPTTKVLGDNYIPYTDPTLDYNNCSTHRTDGILAETKLNLRGNLSVTKFGANGVNNVVYQGKYRVYDYSNQTWSNWFTIPGNQFNVNSSGVFTLSDYLIHENGSSGGFTIGKRFAIQVQIIDGGGLLGSITSNNLSITDGKIARDVFQDLNGDYHEGVNGLADENYAKTVYGDINVIGDYYQNGELFEPGGSGGETIPVGVIMEFPATNNLPEGWMVCNGAALSRNTYSDLFAVIGTAYGSGDGSTTFNIPDKRGRIGVGINVNETEFNTLGKTGGEKSHKLVLSETPKHSHTKGSMRIQGQLHYVMFDDGYAPYGEGALRFGTSPRTRTWNGASGGPAMAPAVLDTNYGGWTGSTDEVGSNGYHNNLQPFIVTNYIIKVSMTTVLAGKVVDSLDGTSHTDAPSVNAVKNAIQSYCNDIAFLRGDGTTPEKSIGTAWQAWKITALTIGGQHGSGLTADGTNQRIIINRPCTILRISASYNWYHNLIGGDHVLHITKNGSALRDIGYWGGSKDYNYYQMISGTCIVTGNFAPGDYIEAKVSIGATGTEKTFSGNDNLIVEIIA